MTQNQELLSRHERITSADYVVSLCLPNIAFTLHSPSVSSWYGTINTTVSIRLFQIFTVKELKQISNNIIPTLTLFLYNIENILS